MEGVGVGQTVGHKNLQRIKLPYDALIIRLGMIQKEDADEIAIIYSKLYDTEI